MNYKLKLALGYLLAASASVTFANTASAANLLEVYQRAQQSDPSIREADATRLATREGKPQAIAKLLPQLNASASAGYTHTSSSSAPQVPVFDPITNLPIAGATGESDRWNNAHSWRVDLTQPLFHWEHWANLKRADAQVAQAEATYKAAEQDLILRVAQRYFNVLYAKDTLDAYLAASEAFSRQLEQADKRFEVGLIAITDVQEARAARDTAVADVISAKRVLATNQELLREVTGDMTDKLAGPDDDMPLKSPDPASEERWVSAAMEQNLSLIAARLNSDIANADVSVARAGHLPSLDLSASHAEAGGSLQNDTELTDGTITHRSLRSADTKSDFIGLQLNFPIYSSGATQSRVRQQVYTYRAARERLERVSRETERAARDNYQAVISNISRVQALKQAAESSRTALQATEAGFEVGTRTTVDVLLSRRTLYSAQTTYARSRYDYILSVIQLKQAAGTLTPQDVAEISSWLKE